MDLLVSSLQIHDGVVCRLDYETPVVVTRVNLTDKVDGFQLERVTARISQPLGALRKNNK